MKNQNLIEREEMAKVQELVERAKLSLEKGAWRRAVHYLKRAEKMAMVYDPI
jgi:RNase P subunit RPR2